MSEKDSRYRTKNSRTDSPGWRVQHDVKFGIVDWGVGGLGFYNLLRERRPDIDVIYLGDQGSQSYGMLTHDALARRIQTIAEEMQARGAERLVVACNAASTVLGSVKSPIPVSGVIEPTLNHLMANPDRTPLGVIGGARTIRSGSYARPLRAAGLTVHPRVAQPLSGIIEAGQQATAGPELQKIIRPIRNDPRLILACTHYIALADQIRLIMPEVEFVDPATIAFDALKPSLSPETSAIGTSNFYTTGDPARMQRAAHLAFGVDANISRW